MSKLRQKNPGTIRTPEEDKGRFNYTMDYTVDVANAAIISPHIAETCNEASSSTYTRHEDVVVWASIQGRNCFQSFRPKTSHEKVNKKAIALRIERIGKTYILFTVGVTIFFNHTTIKLAALNFLR